MRKYLARPDAKQKAEERRRRYKAANRQQLAEKQKARYYANHEQELVERKEKRKDPTAKAKQQTWAKDWARRNPEKVKASADRSRFSEQGRHRQADVKGRRKARERGNRTEPRINWKRVWANFNGTCPICTKPLHLGIHRYHFDHIVAIAQGGVHATSNLQIAHAKCNLVKNRY